MKSIFSVMAAVKKCNKYVLVFSLNKSSEKDLTVCYSTVGLEIGARFFNWSFNASLQ